MSVLLVFVDGIGIGTPGAHNPFDGAAHGVFGPLGGRDRALPPHWELSPLDATLGIAGLPQSASGTATLLTGINVPMAFGEHLCAFPDRRVRAIIEQHSMLRLARERGLTSAFLNAFPPDRAHRDAPVRRGACTCAALAGGGTLRTFEDLAAGRAASFDLTHELARSTGVPLPYRTIRDAATAVARGAHEVDLALFELFLTDRAGHAQRIEWARREIERTEQFLHSVVDCLDRGRDTLVVVSDHGNLEDLSTRGHTGARVPALAWGRHAGAVSRCWTSLTNVAPRLLEFAAADCKPDSRSCGEEAMAPLGR